MLQKHQSRPLWARELKRLSIKSVSNTIVSRPLWARELKHNLNACFVRCLCRAPCGRVN